MVRPPPPDQPVISDRKRIFIHHEAGDARGAERARTLARRLEAQGHAVPDIREVGMRIGESRVRYFFDADEGIAREVAEVVPGAPGPGARVQDFRRSERKPAPNTIEVWLASGR
ncbi:MAG TPA: LytR C-terminal domain-containing protein [Azospirillaceae bacterium]|nr:LytR C-terminal domain-containing protein [Azospirillaceae bacterium]